MKIILAGLLSAIALVSPAIASGAFTPPDRGSPDSEKGTGTRFLATCKHRGDNHRENC